ncbi:DNA-directed RNA polymerase subunit beta [Neobacillus dielmonensis]|uniref:DNA-directed RNA polymerase subunit beta n=1 Tax=Neobacillus dielmonensis TaxID=1347369 RepID=UPI0005A639BB|nr:DNA-directed RNA polymerase subunit beta [Neobacillus dielmonensis]
MSIDNINQERIATREEYKRIKESEVPAAKERGEGQQTEAAAKKRPKERVRIRMIPIWLRLVLLVVFTVVSLIAGAIVGYSVLGDGNAADVFSGSAWSHIRDLVEHK